MPQCPNGKGELVKIGEQIIFNCSKECDKYPQTFKKCIWTGSSVITYKDGEQKPEYKNYTSVKDLRAKQNVEGDIMGILEQDFRMFDVHEITRPLGITDAEFDNAVKNLIRDNKVFEPKPGRYMELK